MRYSRILCSGFASGRLSAHVVSALDRAQPPKAAGPAPTPEPERVSRSSAQSSSVSASSPLAIVAAKPPLGFPPLSLLGSVVVARLGGLLAPLGGGRVPVLCCCAGVGLFPRSFFCRPPPQGANRGAAPSAALGCRQGRHSAAGLCAAPRLHRPRWGCCARSGVVPALPASLLTNRHESARISARG